MMNEGRNLLSHILSNALSHTLRNVPKFSCFMAVRLSVCATRTSIFFEYLTLRDPRGGKSRSLKRKKLGERERHLNVLGNHEIDK